MKSAASLFKLLGDEARLRILRLLSRERLNVSELTSILGIAQSGVSRHLKLLRDAGLLREDRESGWSYYRVDPSRFAPDSARIWPFLEEQLASLPGQKEDDARLEEIRRQRQEEFREPGAEGRLLAPGRSWAAWARALGYLIPPLRVADLGCGEGHLAIEAARWARKVVGVDRSAEVLRRAKAHADRAGITNVTWMKGDLEDLPLPAKSVDLALLSQALYYVARPETALSEAFRVLVPGGRLILLDLRAHREEWVKERLGAVWLGFDEARLRELLAAAGFRDVALDVGARRRGDPFTVLIGTGRRPE